MESRQLRVVIRTSYDRTRVDKEQVTWAGNLKTSDGGSKDDERRQDCAFEPPDYEDSVNKFMNLIDLRA